MSSYICPRCNYTTNRKSNFKHHITRKNICKPVNSDVTIKSIAKSYGIDISSTENVGGYPGVIQDNRITGYPKLSNADNQLPNTDNKKEYKCRFCYKSFKHKSGKSRHEKSRCKERTKDNKIYKKTYTQEEFGRELNKNVIRIIKSIETKESNSLYVPNNTKEYKCQFCNQSFKHKSNKSRHENSRCKERIKNINNINNRIYTQDEFERKVNKEVEEQVEVLADKKAQKMVLSLVDKLIPNQTTTNSHNTTTNNITQNNQTNNNQQVKINNFGEEKTKYITDANLKIMFVDPRNVVIQHIKDTYYHVLHPENFNAKITNCKSKHMHIYKDNDWEKVNKQLTICSMYNKHEKIIENEFERLKPELTDTVRDNYKEYKQSTLHSFNVFKQRMVDIEAVIINGTKKHKQIDLLSEKEVARLAREENKTPGEIFAEHMPDIFGGEDDE